MILWHLSRALGRTAFVLGALSHALTAELGDDDDQDADDAETRREAHSGGPAKVCVSADDDEDLVKLGVEAIGGAHDGELVFSFGVSPAFARELAEALTVAAQHVDDGA